MELQLEHLKYQEDAIRSVVAVFAKNEKNTVENASLEGVRFNFSQLSVANFAENIKTVTAQNGIEPEKSKLSNDFDLCIEMETGTGKTLVYIKTIYELFKHYGFTKFIILVPSIAIRQGTLNTFKTFEKQLTQFYGFSIKAFEYDSKKLNKVNSFLEDQHPKVMIMTIGAFSSDDRILNRTEREDLFHSLPYIDAIASLRPIVIMDEPQEGMDSENMTERLRTLTPAERTDRYREKTRKREKSIFKTLDPLFKLRYSATHKIMKNLIYRLTPYESYQQGLVKKIEVLTVTEKNDEASIKIELTETQYGSGALKAKLKVWKLKAGKFVFEETNWLKNGDNLGEKTGNPSYLNYKIDRINKSLRTQKWSVTFTNGVEIFEKQRAGDVEPIWALQLEWLIHRHFSKTQSLLPKGIKCLSLIFIDKVANYMSDDPKIKKLFIEKYRTIYPDYHDGETPSDQHIQAAQGYYFAQNAKGEFADNEGGLKEQKKIYELILQKKDELLTIGNPVQFIFSHSALGVGWDNPNVFNIATLNNAYSDTRKRQEIGRGLRICVNQLGQRVYDDPNTPDADRINQLTVIPNESYETFVGQYQHEIKENYGSSADGAAMSHNHKGKNQNEIHFKRSENETINQAFKRFWKAVSKKTDYVVAFDENALVRRAIDQINQIRIDDYVAEVISRNISEINDDKFSDDFGGSQTYKLKAHFSPLDILEELSENTGLCYVSTLKILKELQNTAHFVKNPPQFIHLAAAIIRNIELEEMLRGLDYHLTGETFPFNFEDFTRTRDYHSTVVETPNKGVFDQFLVDSYVEYDFAKGADYQPDVVCILKLPKYYSIKTPIGAYQPDFGLVMKRKSLLSGTEREYYFVIETKGTDNLHDKKALTESEIYKIQCAMKHFDALGLEVHYKAPVHRFDKFLKTAEQTMNS